MNHSEGYKTKQRMAILEFLKRNENAHVTAAMISDHLDQTGTHVGVATIYRHLDRLLESGEVRKYTVDGTTSACYQYARSDGQCREHFHLKCEKCGRLIHLECSHAMQTFDHLLEDHGFAVDLYRTVFYGQCRECREQEGAEEE